MAIGRSRRRIAAARMSALASRLLDASTLCAIATVTSAGRPHVNTAYFAWNPEFELMWLSDPDATHSRNLRADDAVAVAVYDSGQSWGEADRGIQLFGTSRRVDGAAAGQYERSYAERFPAYRPGSLSAYRFYCFRARRLKLFDERELGGGVFVTARVVHGRPLVWERTEVYRVDA